MAAQVRVLAHADGVVEISANTDATATSKNACTRVRTSVNFLTAYLLLPFTFFQSFPIISGAGRDKNGRRAASVRQDRPF